MRHPNQTPVHVPLRHQHATLPKPLHIRKAVRELAAQIDAQAPPQATQSQPLHDAQDSRDPDPWEPATFAMHVALAVALFAGFITFCIAAGWLYANW